MKTKKFDWKGVKTATFSIEKATEGGLGYYAITMLQENGIPAKRGGASPYMGHVCITVPAKFEKRAEKLVL